MAESRHVPHRCWLIALLGLIAAGEARAAQVVVLPFRNVPGYNTLDYVIAGAPAVIAEKLEQAQTLSPAFGPRLLPDSSRIPGADAEIAQQANAVGADLAITGSSP
jgi:hypothetical protein